MVTGALVASLATSVAIAQTAAQTDSSPASFIDMPAGVARVLEHPSLAGARVGIQAAILSTGEIVLSHGADDLFAPASVTKLFTTATALSRLGAHFVWRTPLAYAGTRSGTTIDGDLWVLGRGAPDLVEERLWIAANWIADNGTTRITGDIVVDDRYFDAERYGNGWPGGRQVSEAYHAAISASMANFSARRVDNEWTAVDDPAIYLGERLQDLLGKAGVELRGTARRPSPEELGRVPEPTFDGTDLGRASVPSPLNWLYDVESEPLGRLVMDVNKFSNNIMAESLLKTLGAVEYAAPGTATKGLAVVAQFLQEELELPVNSYIQADGSGLSRLNRFAPSQVVELLTRAQRDFHIGPELLASLKLSGLDGWNPAPFRSGPLRGELRVKSGHIRGVNTLSGLVHTDSGETLVFCTMVNDHRAQQWEVDQRMAEIASVLMRTY